MRSRHDILKPHPFWPQLRVGVLILGTGFVLGGCAQVLRRPPSESESSPWWEHPHAAVEVPVPSGEDEGIPAASPAPESTGQDTVPPLAEDGVRLLPAGPRIQAIDDGVRSQPVPKSGELSPEEQQALRQAYVRRTPQDRRRVQQVNEYALWCVERDMWEEARTHLEQAAARDSLAASLYNNLGILYERLGRSQQARSAYLRALALRPDKAPYASNLRRLEGVEERRRSAGDAEPSRRHLAEEPHRDDLLESTVQR